MGRKKPEAEIQPEEDVLPTLYICISESEGGDLESWRWSLVALDGGQGETHNSNVVDWYRLVIAYPNGAGGGLKTKMLRTDLFRTGSDLSFLTLIGIASIRDWDAMETIINSSIYDSDDWLGKKWVQTTIMELSTKNSRGAELFFDNKLEDWAHIEAEAVAFTKEMIRRGLVSTTVHHPVPRSMLFGPNCIATEDLGLDEARPVGAGNQKLPNPSTRRWQSRTSLAQVGHNISEARSQSQPRPSPALRRDLSAYLANANTLVNVGTGIDNLGQALVGDIEDIIGNGS